MKNVLAKAVSIFMALVMVLLVSPVSELPVLAASVGDLFDSPAASTFASGKCGTNLTWALDTEGTLTISGTGDMSNYVMTNFPWYNNKSRIISVVILSGATSIGNYAFYGCNKIASVAIPDGVTRIGNYSFKACTSLETITIPSSVTTIQEGAFEYCSSLESINVNAGNTVYKSINGVLFTADGKTLLQCPPALSGVYTVPSTVTDIAGSAFSGCASITGVIIGDGVTSIGEKAFILCPLLTSVSVSAGNKNYTSISGVLYTANGKELVACPSGFTGTYTIPDGVTSIGYTAFYTCKLITGITIPDSVTSIGESAFNTCSKLTSIIIPDGVTSIEASTFNVCSSLEYVKLGRGITSVNERAFSNCAKLTSVTVPCSLKQKFTSGVINIADKSVVYCHVSGSGATNNFNGTHTGTCACEEKTVTEQHSLGNYSDRGDGYHSFSCVFCSHAANEQHNFGLWVTSESGKKTRNCTKCSAFEVSDTCGADLTWTFDTVGKLTISGTGAMYNFTSNNMPWKIYKDSITSIVISSGVTSIGSYAFFSYTSLKSITFSSSVTSIGESAFYDCTSLASVTLPSSVTSISGYAFYNCSSLKSITIPDNVKSIRGYTFKGCSSLESITISQNVTSMEPSAFESCTSLESITLPNALLYINTSVFKHCSSLKSITIPKNVATIVSNAFVSCSSLTSINVNADNKNFKSIDGVLFTADGKQLVAFPGGLAGAYTIPDGVTSIGDYAFSFCELITSVTIPDSITSIVSTAFSNCTKLTSVNAPCSLKQKFENGDISIQGKNIIYNHFIGSIATDNNNGTHTGACICGEQMLTEQHVYSIFNDLGDSTHNIVCLYCGDISSIESHTFGDWTTDKNGTTTRSCTECDAIEAYGTCGESVAWALDSTGVLTISGTGEMDNFHLDVSPWHNYGNRITSAVISYGVTTIGSHAFLDCTSLTSITIPSSVTSISYGAFQQCTSLESITIPQSVQSIKNDVFSYCSSLTSINVNASNTSYKSIDGVLFTADVKTLVTFPNGLAGAYTIPDGVTAIDDYAFYFCELITSVIFPDSVVNIYGSAFYNCSSLEYVKLGRGIEYVYSVTFGNCAKLTSVNVPCSLKRDFEIGYIVISDKDITYYHVADVGATDNGNGTHTGTCACGEETVTEQHIYLSFVDFGNGTHGIFCNACKSVQSSTPHTFGEWTTGENGTTSRNCSGCDAVEAHGTCGTDLTWTLDNEGKLTISGTGEMHEYDNNNKPWHAFRNKITSAILSYGVTSIGTNAFSQCTALESITVSDSVERINYNAFYSCKSLHSVTFGKGIQRIDYYAFDDSHITFINAPCSLKQNNVINSIDSIEMTYFHIVSSGATDNSNGTHTGICVCKEETVTEQHDYADFADFGDGTHGRICLFCDNTISIALHTFGEWAIGENGTTSHNCTECDAIEAYGTCGTDLTWTLDNEGKLTISGTGDMDDYFNYFSPWYAIRDNITSIVISSGVTSIGEYAFMYCTSPESITIPSSVTEIGNYAFYSCESLRSVTLGKGIQTIGNTAFANCSSLASINAPCTIKASSTDESINTRGAEVTYYHVGETEVRGSVAATATNDGYTGDTYCLTCGELITLGSIIPAYSYIKGDIDGDGEVAPADISLLIAARLETVTLTEAQIAAADIDGNGKIEPADISLLIAFRLGTITELP